MGKYPIALQVWLHEKNAVATIPNKGARFKGGVKGFINKHLEGYSVSGRIRKV